MNYYEFTIEGRLLLISKELKISIIARENDDTLIVMFPYSNEREVYCIDQTPEEVLRIINEDEKPKEIVLMNVAKTAARIGSKFI